MTEETLQESPDATPVARGKKNAVDEGITVTPVRTRRSWIWGAAAIALIILGAIAGGVIYSNASNATQVFVASGDIARGSTIEQADLTTISIAAGQTTTAVPIADLDSILGTVAIVDIPAGGFITETSIADALSVPTGKALVGLTLTPAQLPAQPLHAGDNVVLVPIPAQGTPVTLETAGQNTISANVSQVRTIEGTNDQVVDVYVSAQNAAAVAAQAAAGTLALYLASGGE